MTLDRLKCVLFGHRLRHDRAEDRERNTWERIPNDPDEEPHPIDGCTVVHVCERCGAEKRFAASVDTARSLGVPLRWSDDE